MLPWEYFDFALTAFLEEPVSAAQLASLWLQKMY